MNTRLPWYGNLVLPFLITSVTSHASVYLWEKLKWSQDNQPSTPECERLRCTHMGALSRVWLDISNLNCLNGLWWIWRKQSQRTLKRSQVKHPEKENSFINPLKWSQVNQQRIHGFEVGNIFYHIQIFNIFKLKN